MLRLRSCSLASLAIRCPSLRHIDALREAENGAAAAIKAVLTARRCLCFRPTDPSRGGGARRQAQTKASSPITAVAVATTSRGAAREALLPEQSPPASLAITPKTGKHGKGTKKRAFATAAADLKDAESKVVNPHPSVTVVSIDLHETLREWYAVRHAGDSTNESSGSAAAGTAAATGVAVATANVVTDGATASPSSIAPSQLPMSSSGGASRGSFHTDTLIDRAAVTAAILRHPEVYPQLHTLFFLDKDGETGAAMDDRRQVAEQFDVTLEGAAAVVRSESSLTALLSLMQVYRQLSRQSAWMDKVSGRIGAALLVELSAAWDAATRGDHRVPASSSLASTSLRGEREKESMAASSLAAVERAAALVLLELLRTQFAARQHSRRAPRRRKSTKRGAQEGGANTEDLHTDAGVTAAGLSGDDSAGVWPVSAVRAFLHRTGVAMVRDIDRRPGPREDANMHTQPLADLMTRYALLRLTADVDEAMGNHRLKRPTETPTAAAASTSLSESKHTPATVPWRATAERVQRQLEKELESACASDSEFATVEACRQRVDDTLNALRICHRFNIVVPEEVRQLVHTDAIRIVQRVCKAMGQRVNGFPLLCNEDIARSLEALRNTPGSLYEQLCTDVFSAAESFLAISSHEVIDALLEEKEAHSPPATNGSGRPPLHTPLARLCYALMCAGFEPDAILSSSLCANPAMVDLVDITNAAALFSRTFAVQPLPARVHAAMTDEAVLLVKRALLASQRAVQSSTEALMESAVGRISFADRVAVGGVAAAAAAAATVAQALVRPPSTTSRLAQEPTAAQKKRAKHRRQLVKKQAAAAAVAEKEGMMGATDATEKADGGSSVVTKAQADLLNSQAYYVAISALVESICRGDGEATRRVLRALFPLVALDGSTAYVVESLELILDRIRGRLAQAGSRECRAPTPSPHTSSSSSAESSYAIASNSGSSSSSLALSMTTLPMEQVFMEVACEYQGRVSDCILRQAVRPTSPRERGGEGGVLRGGGGNNSGSNGHLLAAAHSSSATASQGSSSAAARAASWLGKDAVEDTLRLVFRFTVCALTLGMRMSFYEQLVSLHTALRAAATAPQSTNAATTAHSSPLSNGAGGSANVTSGKKSAAAKEESTAARDAFHVVRQLDQLIRSLDDNQLPTRRHPQSAHMRTSSIAVNQVVAAHLSSTATAAEVAATLHSRTSPFPSSSPSASMVTVVDHKASRPQRSFVLSVVHLLFRLAVDHAVEAEPARLRAYRTGALDPAVAHVLSHSVAPPRLCADKGKTKEKGSTPDEAPTGTAATAEPLTLSTLTEIAVVMCVPSTIHHVSHSLYENLSQCVVQVAASIMSSTANRTNTNSTSATYHHHHLVGTLTQRLLCAAATICLRGNAELTESYVRMARALEPLLTTRQCVKVLEDALRLQVPPSAEPVVQIVKRLTSALKATVLTSTMSTATAPLPSPGTTSGGAATTTIAAAALGGSARRSNLSISDTVSMLYVLHHYDTCTGGTSPTAGDIPYGAVLLRLCGPGAQRVRELGLKQCGQLVLIAASLQQRPQFMDACSLNERACIEATPRALAVPVLQAPQKGAEHDIPAILAGYAQLREAKGDALRSQVMRAYLSRTMRACPMLAPAEVVACVEAYCIAGIYHEYLFSVLLGRVADVTQRFSLDLALRLLRCGLAAGHPQVRMACLTAAQPIFVAHVRHVLHSDPLQLATAGSASITILACLRECFPHDPISASVLENIAAHHSRAGVAVTTAALDLAAARGSQDYGVVRALADHCTNALIPQCHSDDLADVVFCLVSCGVRSNALLLALSERFPAVANEVGGYALSRLAFSLHQACVEVDQTLMDAYVNRVVAIVDDYLGTVDSVARNGAIGGSSKDRRIRKKAPVPPFTSPQVAIVLRYLRGCGRQHFALVVPGVDTLLRYLSVLWAAEAQTESNTNSTTTTPVTSMGVASLTLPDVEVVLAAAVEQASELGPHVALVARCATHISTLMAPSIAVTVPGDEDLIGSRPVSPVDASEDRLGGWRGSSPMRAHPLPQPPRQHLQPISPAMVAVWRNDVGMLTRLVSYLVRASTKAGKGLRLDSPAFAASHALFNALYERRSVLLQRHLLLDVTKQTLTLTGKEVHPQLYGLVVEKNLA